MKSDTKSVRIVKDGHEHENQPAKIGTVIDDLSVRTADMLVKAGVAEYCAPSKKGGK